MVSRPTPAPGPAAHPSAAASPTVQQRAQVDHAEGRQRSVVGAGHDRFSRCMRQHGMADWPDPDPNGGGFPTHSDRQLDPAFQPAYEACRSLLPSAR